MRGDRATGPTGAGRRRLRFCPGAADHPGVPSVACRCGGDPGVLSDPARLAAVRATGLLDGPPAAALDELVLVARGLLGAPIAGISLVEAHRQFFTSAHGFPEPVASRRETPISWSFCAHVVERAGPLAVEDACFDPRLQGNPAIEGLGVRAYLGVPLRGPRGEVLGAFCAIDRVPRRWQPEHQGALEALAALASGLLTSTAEAVAARERVAELEEVGGRDALTGLPNRAALDRLLADLGPRAAVLLVDLDGFTAVNDRYGHRVGDQVLKAAAGRLARTVGEQGVVARSGGDELVVLARVEEPGARALANQLVGALSDPVDLGGGLRVTVGCSVGVAVGDGRDGRALLAAADHGVREAKRAGGRRVVVAGSLEDRQLVEQLLAEGAVVPAYQPVVDLTTGEVVGVEALARWPELGCSPAEAFAAARRAGRLVELDWRCRVAAAEGALTAGLGRDVGLFVNVEPAAVGEPPSWAAGWMDEMAKRLRPVVEFTERALLRAPASLLWAVERVRARGWPIALDDVGADPASLTVLPVLRPEVVKLDLNLVRHHPDAEVVRVLAAVMSYAEQTGAVVVAEGIETEEDEERARAYGATLGQGWRFGRPGPLSPPRPPTRVRLGAAVHPRVTVATPLDLFDRWELRVGTAPWLLALSRHLEETALAEAAPPAVLGAFEDPSCLAGATAGRWVQLGARSPLVVAFAPGMSPVPLPGVRGVDVDLGDPLREEWTLCVVGAHFAAAVIGRCLDAGGPWASRRFAYAVTHDRERVLVCARSLLARMGPSPSR